MKIAVEGCCHGELDTIYNHIAQLEQRNGYKVDVVLICGDFQAIRNNQDLQCMAVPPKFRKLGGFYRYYTGEKEAPILTIIIGGNHEASNYLWELYHGGWVAPNIYFLGFAGCVQVNGVRIAGASGIYSPPHYHHGHWETLPYDSGSMRSIYHTREYDISRLSQLSSPDIVLSHDWPQKIEQHGDLNGLLRRKPFFRSDIQTGKLGSPPLMALLQRLKPKWWFSAHLHCRFEATVVHGDAKPIVTATPSARGDNPDEIRIDDIDSPPHEASSVEPEGAGKEAHQSPSRTAEMNPDEIILEDEIEDVVVPAPPQETKFLALDKCIPGRQFLEVIDIPTATAAGEQPGLTFDPEWLAITRAFHPFLSTSRAQPRLPDEEQTRDMVQKEMIWLKESESVFNKEGSGSIREILDCQTFWPTAPGPGNEARHLQPPWYTNPQTVAFCDMLGLENKVNPVPKGLNIPLVSKANPTESEGPSS